MRLLRCALAILVLLAPEGLTAQVRTPTVSPAEVVVGSEAERYLRALQVAGATGLHPWTVRGFTPREAGRLLEIEERHPWEARLGPSRADAAGRVRIEHVSPWADASFNSAFPYGSNDGVVWAGRGFTAAAGGGASLEWGPLDLTVAPIAFWAQNATFDLAPTGLSDRGAFRDPRGPRRIDLPQRFGDGDFSRVDAGESAVHLYLPGTVVGLSNRAQWYGPALRHPLMMGNNAGGFPHAFLGTGRPLDLWLVRLHGRWMAGRLDQSEFSPITDREARRLATAMVVTVVPRGVPGLELGVVSFAHAPWPEDRIRLNDLLAPLDLEFGGGQRETERESGTNHLLSAFVRWTVPSAGVEVYGEYVREDWAPNPRFAATTPEDLGGYMLGLQKVWRRSPERLSVLRGELVNTRWHHLQRGHRARGSRSLRPRRPYTHGQMQQGHTHRGQLFVSPAAFGGSGVLLGWDRYHRDGRWTVELERVYHGQWFQATGQGAPDVVYSAAVEGLRFFDDFELSARIEPAWELNRHTVEGENAFNLHLSFGVRYR